MSPQICCSVYADFCFGLYFGCKSDKYWHNAGSHCNSHQHSLLSVWLLRLHPPRQTLVDAATSIPIILPSHSNGTRCDCHFGTQRHKRGLRPLIRQRPVYNPSTAKYIDDRSTPLPGDCFLYSMPSTARNIYEPIIIGRIPANFTGQFHILCCRLPGYCFGGIGFWSDIRRCGNEPDSFHRTGYFGKRLPGTVHTLILRPVISSMKHRRMFTGRHPLPPWH